MSTKFLTISSSQTKRGAEILGAVILKGKPGKQARVFGLVGDLGGGKTTFVQGLAKGLGIKEKILSPTFIIIRRINNFYHIDCYRIKKPEELLGLGFKKIISDPKNIVIVEWADLVKKIMPRGTIWIDFKFVDAKTRQIVLK